MAFDGAFLYKTLAELRSAVDCHIEKIYQPSFDELVLLLRKKGFTKRLYITVKSGNARIQFTENKYENPLTPPMFCMLLRKYLGTAKLVDIIQPDFERVAVLVFSSFSEMNDITEIRLVCEFIGNNANIILVNENGKIIDALRRSDVEKNDRFLLPGATYVYPKKQDKLNPLKTEIKDILAACPTKEANELLQVLDGFSPLVCREITLSDNFELKLKAVIEDIKNTATPTIIYKPDGTPFDFSYTNITQYDNSYKTEIFEDFSALLDAFYTKRELIARINNSARDIIKLIKNLIQRTEKKLNLRLLDLKKCENREILRVYGELLKANLYAIQNGASEATVENYYDDMKPITIPLDPALTPANNANKYFKDYKKTYTAEQTLTKLIVKDKDELEYFDSVLDSISRCTSLLELEEIRLELQESGYIKKINSKNKQKAKPVLKEYTSVEGYKIIVGKNNTQNDYLTTTLANKNDLWFHTKNIAGSHVVVFCGGNEVSSNTILQAALLAAENSKANNGANVAVDYTPVKFVKKPNGAKPGMVIYTTNKTVYVTPSKED